MEFRTRFGKQVRTLSNWQLRDDTANPDVGPQCCHWPGLRLVMSILSAQRSATGARARERDCLPVHAVPAAAVAAGGVAVLTETALLLLEPAGKACRERGSAANKRGERRTRNGAFAMLRTFPLHLLGSQPARRTRTAAARRLPHDGPLRTVALPVVPSGRARLIRKLSVGLVEAGKQRVLHTTTESGEPRIVHEWAHARKLDLHALPHGFMSEQATPHRTHQGRLTKRGRQERSASQNRSSTNHDSCR